MARSPSKPIALGFCPFCDEPYEDLEKCPAHELQLEPWQPEGSGPDENERLATYDLRFGRGWVFTGSLLMLLGFVAPFISNSSRGEVTVSALRMASQLAPNLWTVPAVALALCAILARRVTLVQMRSARLVIPSLCVFVVASLAYTIARVHTAASLMDATARITVQWGAWMVVAASVVASIGGLRLGMRSRLRV